MSELNIDLKEDEKVVWSGRPAKAPFMLGGLVISVFGLLWLSISFFAMSTAFSSVRKTVRD